MLETDRRYAQAKRAQSYPETHTTRMARLRLRDLEDLFTFRYGATLPDDDAGADDARILAHHAPESPSVPPA